MPLTLVNDVVDGGPDRGADRTRPRDRPAAAGRRCRRSRRCRSRPSRREALIPDELLQQIQDVRVRRQRRRRRRAAPPCRKQGPFSSAARRTQYPHVNARGGGERVVRLGGGTAGAGARGGAACSRWWARGWRCGGCRRSASTGTLVGSGSDAGARDRRRARALRRRRGLRARARRPGAAGADGGSEPAARARGLPVGQRARRRGRRPAARRRRARRWRATKPVRVVYGPGTFINSSVTEITTQLQARTRARAAQADRANEAARRLARSQGRSEAEARRLGRGGREARLRAVRAASCWR